METTDPKSPLYPYVWTDPERMGGQACFRESRVPIRILFDYLQQGYTLDEFLEHFPPVTREQVEGVLRLSLSECRPSGASMRVGS
jgi:uncharacterized protein (DUF433 family)